MTGFLRTFYAAGAAFAGWMARRRRDQAGRWLARAERWARLARQPSLDSLGPRP